MKQRYAKYRRENGVYYSLDTLTRKRNSLNTSDPEEAQRFLNALNEACKQPAINLQIAQAYLQHSDPEYARRSWTDIMDQMAQLKSGNTRKRWDVAMKDTAFDTIRNSVLVKTQGEQLFEVLRRGTVSTNVFLRRLHNFALDMDWLPKAIIPKRQWPKIRFQDKRAITFAEHQKIIAQEKNPEYLAYYELLWHLGGAQSDVASLNADDINWQDQTIAYSRKKTGSNVIIHFGEALEEILKTLPQQGPLFPNIRTVAKWFPWWKQIF
jgi:hypothetical protein